MSIPAAARQAIARFADNRRSAGGLLLTLGSRILAAMGGLAFSIVVAREAGPAGLGVISSIIATMMIIALILKAGMDQVLIRYTAQMHVAAQPGRARRFFWQAVSTSALAAALVTAVGYLLALPMLLTGETLILARILIFALPALAVVNIASGFLKGHRASAIAALSEIGAISGVTAVLVVLTRPDDLSGIAASLVVVAFAMAVLAVVFALLVDSRRRNSERGSSDPISEMPYSFRTIALSGWPFLIIGLSLLATQSGSMALGALTLNDGEVGQIRAAERLALLVSFALTAVNPFIAPRLVAAWKTGGSRAVRTTYRKAVVASIAFAAPMVLGLVVLGPFALAYFGQGFEAAYPLLLIMLVGQAVHASVGSLTFVLTMSEQEHAAMWIALIALIFGALALPIGGAIAGATGFAVAYSTTMILRESLLYWRVRRFLGQA